MSLSFDRDVTNRCSPTNDNSFIDHDAAASSSETFVDHSTASLATMSSKQALFATPPRAPGYRLAAPKAPQPRLALPSRADTRPALPCRLGWSPTKQNLPQFLGGNGAQEETHREPNGRSSRPKFGRVSLFKRYSDEPVVPDAAINCSSPKGDVNVSRRPLVCYGCGEPSAGARPEDMFHHILLHHAEDFSPERLISEKDFANRLAQYGLPQEFSTQIAFERAGIRS